MYIIIPFSKPKIRKISFFWAYQTINITKQDMYFTWDMEHRISSTISTDIIDINEACLRLGSCNWRDITHKHVLFQWQGILQPVSEDFLLMVITSNVNLNICWKEMLDNEGKSLFSLIEVKTFQLNDQFSAQQFTCIIDNQNISHNPAVLELNVNFRKIMYSELHICHVVVPLNIYFKVFILFWYFFKSESMDELDCWTDLVSFSSDFFYVGSLDKYMFGSTDRKMLLHTQNLLNKKE